MNKCVLTFSSGLWCRQTKLPGLGVNSEEPFTAASSAIKGGEAQPSECIKVTGCWLSCSWFLGQP